MLYPLSYERMWTPASVRHLRPCASGRRADQADRRGVGGSVVPVSPGVGPEPVPLVFGSVPEPRRVRNRIHLDLATQSTAEQAELVDPAIVVDSTAPAGLTDFWTVASGWRPQDHGNGGPDPEGNKF